MKKHVLKSILKPLKIARIVGMATLLSSFAQTNSFAQANEVSQVGADSRILYGVAASPYVKKVEVIMKEKNIPFTHIQNPPAIILKAKNLPVLADFAEASPLGKVPALREGNWTISDSAVIAQYLEKTHPVPALYPSDPRTLARALWFEKYGDEVLAAVIHKKIYTERIVKPKVLNIPGDESIAKKAAEEELPPMLDYLEKELGKEKWIAGDEFSVADIALVTHFIDLKIAGESVSKSRWPNLASYIERVSGRKSFN